MNVQTRELLVEELEGDTMTPISLYQRISGKKKFLLESSHKHEEFGRFSFIGSDPVYELINANGETIVKNEESTVLITGSFAEALQRYVPEIENALDIPFIGGGVGFIGYDFIRNFEDIGPLPEDTVGMPDAHLMIFDHIIVCDHLKQKLYLIGIPIPNQSTEDLVKRLKKRREEIHTPAKTSSDGYFSVTDFKFSKSREEFTESVAMAKELIEAGEIFQVVLSRRLTAKAEGNPFTFYRKLRVNNPSPYMYFLDFNDYAVAGSSPESLVKYHSGTILTNPIAGTRPRGTSVDEDETLESELRSDEKELAEHKMLVDLARNDLGRVCEIGSIEIKKFMEVERFQFVMHLVSEVRGKLLDSIHPVEALASCLPAGTVSGAPKIRAMQMINRLESEKRGVYSGAIGYFSACGSMDFALAIRTMVVKDGKGYFQAGAGIVYDSDPQKEYEETNHKLKALLEAAYDSAN
ncbi:anthranilate synthase component I [Bacillus sp. JJ1609]|uniref:anthranilate synthase component I n=1 Tax=Bacillus sp. JJ1609 TaxID=3122977 RepID=UPI002FFD9DA5